MTDRPPSAYRAGVRLRAYGTAPRARPAGPEFHRAGAAAAAEAPPQTREQPHPPPAPLSWSLHALHHGGTGTRRWLPLLVGIPQVLGSVGAGRDQLDRRAIDGWALALLVTAVLSLLARSRRPVAVLAFTAAATAAYFGMGYPHGPAFLALVVAAVNAVGRGHRRATWALLGGVWLAFVVLDQTVSPDPQTWPDQLSLLLWLGVLVGVAELVRARGERRTELRRRQEEAQRRLASEERLRIARELHDVLAHNVSLINVQASTALHLIDQEPERARTALAAIKEASKETLQELRATVGALRADGEAAPRSPTAGLARLDDLVAQSAAVGLHVDIAREGVVRPLPARVDLAAFRIVQEALTNVRRHSRAGAATVTLQYADRSLRIAVMDAGPAADGGSGEEGHGVRGMRERVSALGGSLQAGARGGGGFAVTAVLPLADAP
jgi:signal transduction histidine kinase